MIRNIKRDIKIQNDKLKGIISILLLCIFCLSFLSCSDDRGLKDSTEFFDGTIHLNIYVREVEIVKSRADSDQEALLSDECKHYVLVYSKSGDNDKYILVKNQEIDLANSNNISFSLGKSVNLDDLKIIVVANVPDKESERSKFENIYELSSLFGLVTSLVKTDSSKPDPQPNSPFVMSGIAEKTSNEGTYKVDLHKSSAKISLSIGDGIENFLLSEFTMYNAPESGYYTSYVLSKENNEKNLYYTGNYTYNVDETKGFEIYTYPVISLGNSDVSSQNAGAYFIVKGEFEGEECYYRVDLWDDANKKYLNIDPNHWYQIKVINVRSKGFATPEEASKRCMGIEYDPAIEIKIYDYDPEIDSIVSDSIRKLGVSESITLAGETEMMIKIFTPNSEEYDLEKIKVEIIDGNDWLDIIPPTDLKSLDYEETEGTSLPGNGKTAIYKLKIKNSDQLYSRQSANILISWMGLERIVKVNFNTDFKLNKVCAVKLNHVYINSEGSPRAEESYYWNFLNDIKGIQPENLTNGKIRNEGFHFPMPYGDTDEKQWSYTYDITFNYQGYSNIKNISIQTSGDEFFNVKNLRWEYNEYDNKGRLSLKDPKPNDFTYATGKITFIIEESNLNNDSYLTTKYFTADLYHTGFFDYNRGQTQECLYYEVINFDGLYWLDRNLGATSNKMYVDYDGINYDGDKNARGPFYKIFNWENNSEALDLSGEVCPKGYVVPSAGEWETLLRSTNFKSSIDSEDEKNYTVNYFDSGPVTGKIYFPRGRFYINTSNTSLNRGTSYSVEVNSGESGGGYYWTRTPVSDFVDNEIGCWLQAICLNESSSSFINGSIKNHEMNVRCLAAYSKTDKSIQTIGFKVKGATHVYLYTLDNKNKKSGIFSFPGKNVGSTSLVNSLDYNDNDSYLNFSYTGRVDLSSLYVLFVYKDLEGSIKIISKNASSSLPEAEGWKVVNGGNYFFSWDENHEIYEILDVTSN